ncbi:type I restriction enzyme HsdR N-terminal domain-containing protein [Desulfovibrio inopinatus]|uniref:type I restriction enzyme HsdR N-terminal domain-containing protein n=1 Tax=Desulfovibrio inopinatus TaxID=102109 RepID=UPI000419D34E|nr:type I restriction enzyme HsdR N-terminal domain-containing protein [Desulfovibrio inopinatus]
MHEESLGRTIEDYLTGESIEETSYEEFRQALARLLVEEKGYPKAALVAKTGVCFPVENQDYTRMVDLAAYDPSGDPLMIIIFCSGSVGSYIRETLASARLFAPKPAPLALVTDTKEAVLLETASSHTLAEGGTRVIPSYEEAMTLARNAPVEPLNEEAANREGRILYTYSEFLSGGCCGAACRPQAQ